MHDQSPPELLQAFYARLSRRYGAPGVRLAGFAGRWMVFRTAELAAGIERALIDAEAPPYDTVVDMAEFESKAGFAVGEGQEATLVTLHLVDSLQPVRGPVAPAKLPVLALTLWNLHHPVAVTGIVELDESGVPLWVGPAHAMLRTGSHGHW